MLLSNFIESFSGSLRNLSTGQSVIIILDVTQAE